MKRKARRREGPVKRRGKRSRRVVPRQLTDAVASEAVATRAGFTHEFDDELMVTRICDSILGRLDEAKAGRDRDSRRRQVRRPVS
ncbi:MAG: hypothetical protein ABSG74_10885 [Candidatus Bathyarchaeia archaeon]